MVLFDAVVQLHIRPMDDIDSHYLTYGTWLGTILISRDPRWSIVNDRHGLFEELLSSIPISLLVQPRINQIAIMVNGSIVIWS